VLKISQNWLVRSASEVEQNIVSVERMLHYIELKPEAPYEIQEAHPEGAWPADGLVEFRCLFLECRRNTITNGLFQELFTQISSRAGFGAQEYFDDTGIILDAWA
jgi:hypothetical protein